MQWDMVTFEAVKLFLQFIGALFIAWRAVRWALSRYKEEKHWERRMAAYTDLVTAMGTLSIVNGLWEKFETQDREMSPEAQEAARVRYAEAKRRLEESAGVAQLLLSAEVAEIVTQLPKNLEGANEHADSFLEALELEWAVLEPARKKIIEIGRSDLGISHRPSPKLRFKRPGKLPSKLW